MSKTELAVPPYTPTPFLPWCSLNCISANHLLLRSETSASTFLALLLSFFTFSFVYWFLCVYMALPLSLSFICNSILFLIFPYPLPSLSPEQRTKVFFNLLYLLNIYYAKAWNRILSISLFKSHIKVHIYVDLDWFYVFAVSVGQQV